MGGYFNHFCNQIRGLNRKNLIETRKHLFITLCLILIPLIVNCGYSLYEVTFSVQSTPGVSISKLNRCVPTDFHGNQIHPTSEKDDCYTLIYAPRSERNDAIMKILAEMNGLIFGEDVVGFDNSSHYLSHIYTPYDSDYRFATAGVFFDEDQRGNLNYHIWGNTTYQDLYFGTNSVYGLGYQYLSNTIQLAVENAINKYAEPSISPIEFILKENPLLDMNAYTLSEVTPTFYMVFIIGIIYVIYYYMYFLNERKSSMLDYLRGLGIYESVLFHSQFTRFFIISFIASLLWEISGRLLDKTVLVAQSYALPTFFMTFYLIGMCYMGQYLSTFIRRLWRFVLILGIVFLITVLYCVSCIDIGIVIDYYSFFGIIFLLPNSLVFMGNYLFFVMHAFEELGSVTWSSLFVKMDKMLPIKLLLPNVVFCFVILFFYFWYSSYKNAYHLKCFFFFKKSFWVSKPPKPNGVAEQATHDSARDEKNSRDHNSIVFSYVTKVFPSCTAVSELHFEITPNQIYTLLGPNGCGKTTTVSMLTGVFPPTYGNIYVSGQDMEDNRESMRDRCGVCSQFDHFWTGFTCSDMFDVIGRIKGFSNSEIESEKKRLLGLFNLSDVENKNVDTFSGGMKRKLTVALACMKGFDILVLDEPTSGMDLISRTELWNVLLELKKDHTILLTTHSMEEADLLSDTVGIMFMGRLRAVGTPSGMKKHYGKGYKVDILLEEGTNSEEILNYMHKYMLNSEKISESLTKVSIGIGKEDMKFLPRFLKDIKSCRCTKEWLISPSTMDEVFIKVVESNSNVEVADVINKEEEEKEKRVQIKLCVICGVNPAEKVTLYSKDGRPFDVDGLFCHHCVSLPGSERDQSQELDQGTESTSTTLDDSVPKETELSSPIQDLGDSNINDNPEFKESLAIASHADYSATEPVQHIDEKDLHSLSSCSIIMILNWLNFTLLKKSVKGLITYIGLMAVWFALVFLMSFLPISFYRECDDGSYSIMTCINNTAFNSWYPSMDTSFLSRDQLHLYMKTSEQFMNTSFIVDDSQSDLKADSIRWVASLDLNPFSDRYVFFNSTNIDADIIQKQNDLIDSKNESSYYYRVSGTSEEAYDLLLGMVPQYSLKMTGSGNVLQAEFGMYTTASVPNSVMTTDYRLVESANLNDDYPYPVLAMLSMSYLHTFSNSSMTYVPRITPLVSKLWHVPVSELVELFINLIPVFYIIFSFFMINRIVSNRSQNSISLLYINGVQSYHYVTSLFLSYSAFLLFFIIIFILIFASFQSYLVELTPFIASILLWGCIHSVAFFLLISCCFTSSTLAVIVNVVVNFLALIPFYSDYDSPIILTAIPGGSLMLYARYIFKSSVTKRALCNEALVISLVFTVIYIALSYLIMWISQDLAAMLDRYYQKKRGSGSYVDTGNGVQLEEESVVKESQFVESSFEDDIPGNHNRLSLLVKGVSKYFFKGGVKRVFPEVSFSIKDNEIFGLLGPNGAGKTTLINILTCKLNPNFGEMKVFGYDYSRTREVKQLISVVPQFDVFFDDMTVEEHLMLIAKLHHVNRADLDQTCKEKAEAVGLSHNSYRHNSGNLSGGQKRRLTLGMALMSQPHLLFLDEPTTGLDPETRFAIWDTIKKMQESMTILITTHSMEEADALCTRVAIMTKNGLQCIGDQIHLKNKFGKGFLLSISLDPSIPDVKGYVKANICPMAEYLETKLNIHTFTILKEKVDLSNLILKVMKLSKEEVVTYWSVNESSLGDVFERICKDDER